MPPSAGAANRSVAHWRPDATSLEPMRTLSDAARCRTVRSGRRAPQPVPSTKASVDVWQRVACRTSESRRPASRVDEVVRIFIESRVREVGFSSSQGFRSPSQRARSRASRSRARIWGRRTRGRQWYPRPAPTASANDVGLDELPGAVRCGARPREVVSAAHRQESWRRRCRSIPGGCAPAVPPRRPRGAGEAPPALARLEPRTSRRATMASSFPAAECVTSQRSCPSPSSRKPRAHPTPCPDADVFGSARPTRA